MKFTKNKAFTVLATLAVTIIIFFSLGCSSCALSDAFGTILGGDYWLQFRNSAITMSVGDKLTLTREDFIFEDGQPDEDWTFTLETDDYIVADVAGRTVHAVKAGNTKIVATAENGKKARLNVRVVEDIDQIVLGFPMGQTLRSSGNNLIEVTVADASNRVSLDGYKVDWFIDGEKSDYQGKSITLPKASSKVYLLEAVVTYRRHDGSWKTLTAKANACYYSGGYLRPTASVSSLSPSVGEKVDFSLETGVNYVADWYVNGKLIASGENSCSFTPTEAGYYDYSVVSLGQEVDYGVITVLGSRSVSGVKIDVDSSFPDTVVTWDDLGENFTYSVKVTQDGDEQEYIADENKVIIDVDVTRDFTVDVKSMGDGVISGSDYGESVVTFDGTRDSLSYLQKTWHGGNYYLSSEREFYEFFDYMMYYRPQPEQNSSVKSEQTVYLAFEGNAYELMERSFAWSGATGSYTFKGERVGNIASLSIEFFTGNVPTVETEYNKIYHNAPADMAEYHISGRKGGVPYFPSATKGDAPVFTSEQLYRVAELGYRPVPQEGSVAEELYENAKEIIDTILDEHMSDYDIAHAVYDFIMAKNTYDSGVLKMGISEAVYHKSFYLDSVLEYGENYGVCDAMAKGYSFLCNMAGVDCVRVTGYAGRNGNYGGHAWNKVMVDGKWYVVDCTWGDVSLYYATGTVKNPKANHVESASHSYFLLSDSDVANTHVQDMGEYPETSPVGYGVYGLLSVGESASDLYVQERGEKLTAEIDKIALSVMYAWPERVVQFYGMYRISKFAGTDFAVSEQAVAEAKSYLSNPQSNVFKLISVRGLRFVVLNSGNVFYILVTNDDQVVNMALSSDKEEQEVNPPWYDGF